MINQKMPQVKAFDGLSTLAFEPDQSVLSKWNPSVRSASEGEDGVISIYDIIGEDSWTGNGFTAKRMAGALRSIGAKDVTVNLNSPGGDFFEGIAIYNLLREHKGKVTVKVMGLAASAASVIAMAGDEIQISEVGFLMIHNAWAVAIGNRHDFADAAATLEPFDDAMAGLYATRAEVEKSVAAGWMDDETWFNGTKAIEVGLADSLFADSYVSDEMDETTKSLAAIRRVDAALAKQGLPRSERRTLLGEIKRGTHDAAVTAKHDAGDDWSGLSDLLNTVKS